MRERRDRCHTADYTMQIIDMSYILNAANYYISNSMFVCVCVYVLLSDALTDNPQYNASQWESSHGVCGSL